MAALPGEGVTDPLRLAKPHAARMNIQATFSARSNRRHVLVWATALAVLATACSTPTEEESPTSDQTACLDQAAVTEASAIGEAAAERATAHVETLDFERAADATEEAGSAAENVSAAVIADPEAAELWDTVAEHFFNAAELFRAGDTGSLERGQSELEQAALSMEPAIEAVLISTVPPC